MLTMGKRLLDKRRTENESNREEFHLERCIKEWKLNLLPNRSLKIRIDSGVSTQFILPNPLYSLTCQNHA